MLQIPYVHSGLRSTALNAQKNRLFVLLQLLLLMLLLHILLTLKSSSAPVHRSTPLPHAVGEIVNLFEFELRFILSSNVFFCSSSQENTEQIWIAVASGCALQFDIRSRFGFNILVRLERNRNPLENFNRKQVVSLHISGAYVHVQQSSSLSSEHLSSNIWCHVRATTA